MGLALGEEFPPYLPHPLLLTIRVVRLLLSLTTHVGRTLNLTPRNLLIVHLDIVLKIKVGRVLRRVLRLDILLGLARLQCILKVRPQITHTLLMIPPMPLPVFRFLLAFFGDFYLFHFLSLHHLVKQFITRIVEDAPLIGALEDITG